MKDNDLRERTKKYALRIINLVNSLPTNRVGRVIAEQVVRSGTSVGAQYREAFRAKSKPDYISKITGSLGELEETQYWLELVIEAKLIKNERLGPLLQETNELIAILTTIVLKLKRS